MPKEHNVDDRSDVYDYFDPIVLYSLKAGPITFIMTLLYPKWYIYITAVPKMTLSLKSAVLSIRHVLCNHVSERICRYRDHLR